MTALALAPPPRPLKETSPAAPCVAAPGPCPIPALCACMPLRQLRHVCVCGLAHGTSDGDWAYVSRIRVRPQCWSLSSDLFRFGRFGYMGAFSIQAHYKLIEIPESDVSWRNFGLSIQ